MTKIKINKEVTISDQDIDQFKNDIEEAAQLFSPTDTPLLEEEIREELPKHNNYDHGNIQLVKLSDISKTASGALTKTSFFENLEIDHERYKDIVLTPEEAKSLSLTMRQMSTGTNSSVPIRCTPNCPFKEDCWYAQNNKQPVGRLCLPEIDLLNYHTRRFIDEFNVQMEDHSELMLIQELSELIILETRLNKVLALPNNAQLMQIVVQVTKFGDELETEVEHWAVQSKEKIKNRRMKILDSLNATRKGKLQVEKLKPKDTETKTTDYQTTVERLKKVIEEVGKLEKQLPLQTEYIEV